MNKKIVNKFRKAMRIAWKDSKIYYFSPPSLMMGLLFPAMMFLTFWIGRGMSLSEALPGLAALSSFFGGSSIGVTTIALERTKQTFDTQFAMPVTPLILVLGKTIASVLFGFTIAIVPISILALFIQDYTIKLFLLVPSIAFAALAAGGLGMTLSAGVEHVHDAMTPLNIIRIPMMFISGLFLPISKLPSFLQSIAYFMPLTYSVLSLKYILLDLGSMRIFLGCIGGLAIYTIVFLIIAAKRLERSLE